MQIKLIKINKNHEKFILNFRNKKFLRKNSFSKKKISIKEHSVWFKNFIDNINNLGFVIQLKSKKIGYVRYEYKELYYEISIGIEPRYRKKNFASKALWLSEKKLKKKLIIAKVVKNNKFSEFFFKRNNYELLEKRSMYNIYIKFINSLDYKKEFKLIDDIQDIRKRNNVNWMNILKIAFSKSPNETKKVFKRVYIDDGLISKKSKKLFS
jgi:hypothetical protein